MDRFLAVAELWLHDTADAAAFEALERELAAIMAPHGGRIERAVRVDRTCDDDPFEIHVVSFPDRDAFDAYRRDSAALAERRARLIARTALRVGREITY